MKDFAESKLHSWQIALIAIVLPASGTGIEWRRRACGDGRVYVFQ